MERNEVNGNVSELGGRVQTHGGLAPNAGVMIRAMCAKSALVVEHLAEWGSP